jgi:hypothetical protein
MLKNMLVSGANRITCNKETLDALNVFPVPDGDTGTNMSYTAQAAVKNFDTIPSTNVIDIAKMAASGSLRGARGNSGVILSQLMRGFARGIEENASQYSTSSASNKNFTTQITCERIAHALQKASETAYKAMMKPKEGTILTVSRLIGERAKDLSHEMDDMQAFFKEILRYGNVVLERTKQQLPELKAANVVDAGGKGYLFLLEGFYNAICGNMDEIDAQAVSVSVSMPVISHSPEDIKFAYCTEFLIIDAKPNCDMKLMEFFSNIGDSVTVVADEEGESIVIKCHVHTNNPGKALEEALKYGGLSDIAIDNMKLQNMGLPIADTPPEELKENGFIAVAAGEGFTELLTELGVDYIVEGGQTMNPSAEDILSAIDKVHAKNIYICPNNSNIILAAQQAAKLYQKDNNEKSIFVINTKSIPQGIAALISFSDMYTTEQNTEKMQEAVTLVKTGQITSAVRSANIDGFDIEEGDLLCMEDGKIVHVAKELTTAARELVKIMVENGDEIITFYSGEGLPQETADEVCALITEDFPDCETDMYTGGQPVYHLILSVEK